MHANMEAEIKATAKKVLLVAFLSDGTCRPVSLTDEQTAAMIDMIVAMNQPMKCHPMELPLKWNGN